MTKTYPPYPTRCFAITDYTPIASIELMQMDLCSALRQAGVLVAEHLHSQWPNFDLFKHQMAQIGRHRGRRFVFDCNAEHNWQTDGQSIYDAWNMPRFSFLTDSPVHKLKKLRSFPKMGVVGVVDLDFIDLFDTLGLSDRKPIPFAHAGPPPLPDPPTTDQRDIDVLIVGNISSPLNHEEWLQKVSGSDPKRRDAYDRGFERARSSDTALWDCVVEEHQSAGFDLGIDAFTTAVQETETQLIASRRREILTSLKGRNCHYYGALPEGQTITVSDGTSLNSFIPFLDVADLMMRAKIVMNISPSFRNGAHERVFYGLSRGAHILTEPTRFLTHETTSDLGIDTLPYDVAGVNQTIDAILDRGSIELDTVRENARHHYGKTHTWAHRIGAMLDKLESEFWPDQGTDAFSTDSRD